MNWLIDSAPMIGLLFFFIVFLGITAWAWNPRRKNALQALAEIPLREEKTHGRE